MCSLKLFFACHNYSIEFVHIIIHFDALFWFLFFEKKNCVYLKKRFFIEIKIELKKQIMPHMKILTFQLPSANLTDFWIMNLERYLVSKSYKLNHSLQRFVWSIRNFCLR